MALATPSSTRAQSADLFMENAEDYSAGGDHAVAAELLAKALDLEPDNAFAHFLLAEALIKIERRSKAVTHYWRAYELNPEADEAPDAYAKAYQLESYFSDVRRLQSICASGTDFSAAFPAALVGHEATYYRDGEYGEDYHRFKVDGERLTWWNPMFEDGFKVFTPEKWTEGYILARADPVVVCTAEVEGGGLIYSFNDETLFIAERESRHYVIYRPLE